MELFDCYHFRSVKLPARGSRTMNKSKVEQIEVQRSSSVGFVEDKNFWWMSLMDSVGACKDCSVFALLCQLSLTAAGAVFTITSCFPLALPIWPILPASSGAACPHCAVVSYPTVSFQLPKPARSCLISSELPMTDPTEDDGN